MSTSKTDTPPDRLGVVSSQGTGFDGVRGRLGNRKSINFWLRWLVVACIIPAWGAAIYLIVDSYTHGRETKKTAMLATARALLQAVDGELARTTSELQVLATSPSLTSGDLAEFYTQAKEVARDATALNVLLTDRSGQQIFNTLRPFGAPLPMHGKPDVVRSIFETGKPVIIDLFLEPVLGAPIMGVEVPVVRNGKVIYTMAAGFLSDRFATVLRRQNSPPDWVMSILDSNGTVVARTHSPEEFVGKKAPPPLLRRMSEVREDVHDMQTLEGTPVLAAFSRSLSTNWSVMIGIPNATLIADIRRSLWLNVAAIGVLLAGGWWLAGRIRSRIVRSIQALSQPSMALASGQQISIPTIAISEVAEIGEALAHASRQIAYREADRVRYAETERHIATAKADAANVSALLEAVPDAMIVVRRDGIITYANGHAETIFDYPKTELVGQAVETLIPSRLRAGHRAHVAGFFAAPNLRTMGPGLALFARRKDAAEFPVEVSLSPIDINEENHVIATIRDVTERKNLEAAVETSRAQLIDSARLAALGVMAGGIAHEINNPLAVVDALVQDLAEAAEHGEIAAEEVVRVTAEIARYVDRIDKIMKSMRHIARDGATDPFEEVAAATIVEQALSICVQRFKGHSVALQTPAIDPGLLVSCREVQISQVLMNLLQNAFDAVQEKSGDKWVRLDVAATDDKVVFSVVDCGRGIPSELKARIMEPFFTTKPVGKGTGLGLSLSKKIAEEHGGALEVDEDHGHTRFSLTLMRSERPGATCF